MPHRRVPPKAGVKPKTPSPNSDDERGAKGGHDSDGDAEPEKGASEGISKILARLATMDANFNGLRTELREGFQTTEFKISELEDKAKAVDTKCEGNVEKVREITETSAGLKTRSEVHGARLADIEQKIEQLERGIN